MDTLTVLGELAKALGLLSVALAQAPQQEVLVPRINQEVVAEVRELPLPISFQPLKEVEKVIKCESNWKNVTVIDTNGKHSRGIGQFQDATWNEFSKRSGIKGTSTDPIATIQMMNWAFQNGLARHWTCAKMLGITK